MDDVDRSGPGERGTSVPRGRVLRKRIGSVALDSPRNKERSPLRFSLRFLLIGMAILSLAMAGLAYVGHTVHLAVEAEMNLQSYIEASELLTAFVRNSGRWPKSEQELRMFKESLPHRPDRGFDIFERTVIAYDFDLRRESLESEEFRGLRHREPIYPAFATEALDRLLVALEVARARMR